MNVQSFYSPDDLTQPEPGIFIDDKIILFDSFDVSINKTNAFSLDLSKDNRSLIYAFGGLIPTNESNWDRGNFVNDFYQIDVTSYPISISPVTFRGTLPSVRATLSSIFDDKGKLYIWGGKTLSATDQAMYIFDTFDATWSRTLPSYVPVQRYFYSVTYRDGKIYYIGCTFSNNTICVDIREILIYDTLNTNNPWTIRKATTNGYINNRYLHSAVLASDNQSIILYGGSLSNSSGIPSDYLITLNLQTFEFSEFDTRNMPSTDDVSTNVYQDKTTACANLGFELTIKVQFNMDYNFNYIQLLCSIL
ncbi:10508_t:CDS:2 [Ambispora gerdemannii]|uniref:10508_t:CDS:1 n=1 Tax=Ambispora gerdemannii TaxID=144530 RepID=A0A9N8WES9_9GLOM|nr:10508_t:CDS:2 [Ambispora gerdemannii]